MQKIITIVINNICPCINTRRMTCLRDTITRTSSFNHRLVVLLLALALATDTTAAIEQFEIPTCYTPCADGFTGDEIVPGSQCKHRYTCRLGKNLGIISCSDPLIWDVDNGYCNFPWLVVCKDDFTCPPTKNPTPLPTESPTKSPTRNPTPSPSRSPTNSPSTSPVESSAMNYILSRESQIERIVLISKTPSGQSYRSTNYNFDGLVSGLQKMAVDGFGADFRFFLGEGDPSMYKYGLVNFSAFLANAVVETIREDSCDENNWQGVNGRFAIANSCGQEGRSYQNEACGDIYSCKVDTDMEITAVTSGNEVMAPPPFQCQPGSGTGNFAGYWDASTGESVDSVPYSNSAGRTDIEGCCWWGRGALHTRGVCNIGKFNYYVGKGAADRGENSFYPDIDFCQNPEATCASQYEHELRWTTAMFEWADRIQRYSGCNWEYMDKLMRFLDGGMTDDSFILSVGRILTADCHEVGCTHHSVRFEDERRLSFYTIINDVLDIPSLIEKPSTSQAPTPMPFQPIPMQSSPFSSSTATAITETGAPPVQSILTLSPTSAQKKKPDAQGNNSGKIGKGLLSIEDNLASLCLPLHAWTLFLTIGYHAGLNLIL